MDILREIITNLNKEEVRFFKMYTQRITTEQERKDLKLFDFVRKNGPQYEEDVIFDALYPSKSKNAFYRLKNRLAEDITKSLTLQHYDDDDEVLVYHLISTVKHYHKKGAFKLCSNYLKKAEKLATEIEAYDLLDIVYSEHIKLAQDFVKINPEPIIQKRKENQTLLNTLRAMDDVLAMVIYKTKTTQNFHSKQNPIIPLLEQTVNEVLEEQHLQKSPKLRFKIYRSVSQILLQRREYKTLEEYLLNTIRDFTKEGLFNKNTHESKLQMLTYLVNSLHINGKNKDSLAYAEELKKSMDEFDGFKREKYTFFYYNALVNNYALIDKRKAIEVLLKLKNSNWLSKTPYYEVFVLSNLAILHFDLAEFKQSIKNIAKLYQLDGYKNTDEEYKFKTEVAELIIRYELGDFDFLEYRIKQLKKDFKKPLLSPENSRELQLIQIIEQLIRSTNIRGNKSLSSAISLFIENENQEQNTQSEMINYKNWLSSKI